ncbi:MAG: hypothetical protein KF687_12400 [Cyclobacteriaceae bacterium]|nr:hypothetical protein [Cyclobacteriaceae bacterium]
MHKHNPNNIKCRQQVQSKSFQHFHIRNGIVATLYHVNAKTKVMQTKKLMEQHSQYHQ